VILDTHKDLLCVLELAASEYVSQSCLVYED
jgi:hypothetical protein